MSTNPPAAAADMAPDPEEDDLDDLDDVLDSFAAKPSAPSTTTTAPSASGPGRPPDDPASTSAIVDETDDVDLAKDLQKGMEALIGELGENKEMQAQFEAMMAELVAAGQAPTDAEAAEHVKSASESMPQMPEEVKQATSSAAGGSKKGEESFQDTIRKTMERMQASDSTAKNASTSQSAAADSASSEEQMLMELMKSLNASGGGEGGSEEDFNTMLMSMMTQLTNKEILYEPMKELHDKFPAWMEKHAADEDKADMERYVEQQRLVGEIVGRFERKGYSDDNEEDREYIVERMQKVSHDFRINSFMTL